MASNSYYYQADHDLPGWKKLSTGMKSRYFRWKSKSDSCWQPKYKIVVSYNAGRRPFGGVKIVSNVYHFENIPDAEECQDWWKEYNPDCSVHIL